MNNQLEHEFKVSQARKYYIYSSVNQSNKLSEHFTDSYVIWFTKKNQRVINIQNWSGLDFHLHMAFLNSNWSKFAYFSTVFILQWNQRSWKIIWLQNFTKSKLKSKIFLTTGFQSLM